MKKALFVLMFTSLSVSSFAQYKKVYAYGDYQKNWALVKTSSGTYGFIDQNKKQIVTPIYSKIEKFGNVHPDFAVVKAITDTYGLIDKNGKKLYRQFIKKLESLTN